MFKYFDISVFACVCICMSVRVSVSLCVHVFASVLSAFVLSLFWSCFSRTIRVINCYYLLKNPCQRKESLLGILSLESQTSFSCN